ncbi:hypothetical protein BLNAU_15688 [Blattamonas nauphoetae]|uniref:Uncharacterized protein n=1 Tax=Blattamonas nauphoetae TaxID=2049346 RepID=A0ABQ9XFJ2_9EUKA|nr:hypothetical protein BLNAU_15688 [Blattamonas nauphoetae]
MKISVDPRPTCTLVSDSIDVFRDLGDSWSLSEGVTTTALDRRSFLRHDERLVGTTPRHCLDEPTASEDKSLCEHAGCLFVFGLVDSVLIRTGGRTAQRPVNQSLVNPDQHTIWTKTIEIDDEQPIFFSSSLAQRDQMDHPDRRPKHPRFADSHNQSFILNSPFFQASTFAACTVAMKDGLVDMDGLDGDELRLFWTSWKVSELAPNMSHSKSEVQQASGRIRSRSVALLGRQAFLFGGGVSDGLQTDATHKCNIPFISPLTDTFTCSQLRHFRRFVSMPAWARTFQNMNQIRQE